MEYQQHSHSQTNPFDSNFYPSHEDNHYYAHNERCPMIPVEIRLK